MYAHRKETIERCFGTTKEHHGMRYTQRIGNEKMRMKVGMTFACLNMKKLARLTALLLTGALLLALTACGAAPLAPEQQAKQQILNAINQYRTSNGT